MHEFEDHYAVLGVLPSAEDTVIRAAYRALAQRYHPDRYEGDRSFATARMAEINAAYATLSDPKLREAYNEELRQRGYSGHSYYTEAEPEVPPTYDPLADKWRVALDYYPDLNEFDHRLSRISWRLAYAYRLVLLDKKNFGDRKEIAAALELEFLRNYFGSNEKVLAFARFLIESNNRKAARALNAAISVLGASAEPELVVRKIVAQFALETFTRNEAYKDPELLMLVRRRHRNAAERFVELLGYTIGTTKESQSFLGIFSHDVERITVTKLGSTRSFDVDGFINWAAQMTQEKR